MGSAGGKLIVVANRMPVRRVPRGRRHAWEVNPGGLVSALYPLVLARGGAWVGGDGTTGKRGAAAFEHEGIRVCPVHITVEEFEKFYAGFSNRTLWPLYHDALRAPAFHRHWWWPYVEVNQRFATAAAALAGRGDLVWVQDYQLQLVPAMVRAQRADARIGFFLHTPFPPEELFAKLPWRRQILEGLLGSDVVGFQDKLSAQNFARTARRFTGARGTDSRLKFGGREIVVDVFPISIDVARYRDLAGDEDVIASAARFRESWNNRRIILGVDRLDYTKGIDTRLRAYEEVLRRGKFGVRDVVMIQIAVPTRQSVDDYAELRETVERYVGRINGSHATTDDIAVHYVYRNLPTRELLACYLAADVMMVTPFRDGMNLVAKEYVVTRTANTGVLLLSEFAGAAAELRGALMVNPYDIDGMANLIEQALTLDPADARRRMAGLRRAVESSTVHDWSDAFISRLAGGEGVA